MDKPRSGSRANHWVSLKNWRFWLVLSILLYTLLGFFAIPAVIQNQLVAQIKQQLHRTATVEKVEFNPYALSLSVQGFDLADSDGTRLAKFDEFAVNFQLSSLFRWAWTFAEIRLDSPQLLYERFADGDSRLDRLLAELAPTAAEPEGDANDKPAATGLPQLLIHSLVLNHGQVTILDQQPESPVEIVLGPIDIAVEQLSTLPDQNGQQQVAVQLPSGGVLSWQGSINISPFQSEGELTLDNLQLHALTPYLASQITIEDFTAALSSTLRYKIGVNEDGQFAAAIDSLNLILADLSLTGLVPSAEFISIPEIKLLGGALRFPEQAVSIQHLVINEPKLELWRDAQGDLNLNQLLIALPAADSIDPAAVENSTEPASPSQATATGPAPPPWKIVVDEFSLRRGAIGFVDQGTHPGANVGLIDLNMTLATVNTAEGGRFPFSVSTTVESNQNAAGIISLDGELGVFPALSLQVNSRTVDIDLSALQPWVNQLATITIDGGTLDSDLSVQLLPNQGMTISGTVKIPALNLSESGRSLPIGGWSELAINDIEVALTPAWQPQTVVIGEVILQQPHVRIAIDKHGNLNLAQLMVESNANTTPQPGPTSATSADNNKPSADMTIKVGGVSVDNGNLDFSDFSLPLPFAAVINQLNGSVTAFSNGSNEPPALSLEGKVNEYGSARIVGEVSLFEPTHATDLSLEFLNLEMARVSPYSAQFAGRKIEQGKLDLNLRYALQQGKLNAKNDIVLRDLKLGEKIDHPDATNLPLGIAIALLKDSEGIIDIKLPIKGNLNNPEFKVGPVIWKAFAKLIAKIATSPFRLLGNLIGVDSDDLGEFQFRAGLAALTPPELEKVAQLQKALQQRPNLIVEINGKTNPNIDRPALTLMALQTTLLTVAGKQDDNNTPMLDRNRKLLEKLFKQTFPDIKLRTLRKQNKFAPTDNPDGKAVFDESAYISDLRSRLLASITISDQQLLSLAQQRAQSLRTAFIAEGNLSEDRVRIIDPGQGDSSDPEWVVMQLKITN